MMEENVNKELEEFRKSLESQGFAQGQFDAYKDLHSYIYKKLKDVYAEIDRIASSNQKETPEEAASSLRHLYQVKAQYTAYNDILNIVDDKIKENEENFDFSDENPTDNDGNAPKTGIHELG